AQAEEARRKLASLGVAKVQYEAGKDVSGYFKQPAVKACNYDPSITAESVPRSYIMKNISCCCGWRWRRVLLGTIREASWRRSGRRSKLRNVSWH
ncbi:hypothetical protein, partial [Paenibacillus phytohabitans]|uniref:hypothetical protein n=1 Tax=Paenibacillus phytohabitans TaxID=2654978 RepID=UPI0014922E00